jgi:two-component system OmpR family response regulator
MAFRILLIDDDTRLFDLLATYLRQNGMDVVGAHDAVRGLARLDADAFDAVLLDIMMPGMNGLEACKRIRAKSNVPLIMLTAKGDETDRVVGLEMGADDYVAKPFSPRELLARLRAVLRRAKPEAFAEKLTVGDLVIDLGGREAQVAGRLLDLTGLELDLLVALAKRAGKVISRETLLVEAGRSEVSVNERTVDVHISHLRQKLGDGRIRTVRGVGYVLAKESP